MDKKQTERFQTAALSLGCDPSEEAFKAGLGKIARAKPKPSVPPEKPKQQSKKN